MYKVINRKVFSWEYMLFHSSLRLYFLLLAVVTCVLLVHSQCVGEEDEEAERRYSFTERRTLLWEPGRPVAMIETNGKLFVRGGKRDDIEIKAIKTAFASDISVARKMASLQKLSIEAPRERITIKTSSPAGGADKKKSYIDYNALLPREVSIELRTVGGNIDVAGINGEMTLQTASGSVHIKNSTGITIAESDSGDIKISSCPGLLKAETESGNISYLISEVITAPEVHLTTASGTIMLSYQEDIPFAVEISTRSGEIDISDADLDPDTGMDLHSHSDDLLDVKRYHNAGGGPTIYISTINGAVFINKQDAITEKENIRQ